MENPNFIIIDGSYFVFFRYYALLSWFKLAKKDEEMEDPFKNETFVEKFRTTFISKMKEIPKKLKMKNAIILACRDCPRKTIWRMKHMPSYKANRVYDDSFMGGPFFKMTYKEELFIKGGANMMFKYPKLEADDCAAILTKDIVKKYPNANVKIITSDMDYLQLACENVELYDLKYNKLTERKSSFNNAEKDLFVKILTGDKSDNITGVFKKCGPKTACKYFDDRQLFKEKLETTEGSKEKYELNRKIIDFNYIPLELIQGFKDKYGISS